MTKYFFSVSEVAEREGITVRRVRQLCECGKIEAEKVGGTWVIQRAYKRLEVKPGRPRKRVPRFR